MKRTPMSKPRAVVLAVLLIGLLWTAANGYKTRQGITRYCQESVVGISLSQAEAIARELGYRFEPDAGSIFKPGRLVVIASGAMGRLACQIEHDGERVTGAELVKRS
ncbi:MAG: hypothetical protein K0B16_08195 [Burkholderiaceae bacterium]|nr:hypothetical protein [Burkholderiaceae bacterium]